MYWSNLLLTLSVVGSGLTRSSQLRREALGGVEPSITANETLTGARKYIIEAGQGQDVDALISQLSARPGTKILKKFSTDLFAGVSVEVTQDNLDSLRALSTVANAWQSNTVQLANNTPIATFEEGVTVANYSVHASTGVDKLHAKGITGAGATVAVIDTGVWYTHPALGGGFGPGFKVAGGYDLVGDQGWPHPSNPQIPSDPKVPDNDPADQLGHGTHVAGILAGKTDSWQGVAPDATILAYKVSSNELGGGLTDDETLIDAFIMAYEAGADVITCSISGASGEGFADNALATIASRIAETGVIVTITAGDSADSGPFEPGSAASAGKFVISVASMDPDIIPALPFAITFTQPDGTSNTTTAAYLPPAQFPGHDVVDVLGTPWPTEVKDFPIWPSSLNTTDGTQACNPLPDNTPDLTNMVALVLITDVDISVCSQSDQVNNLAAKGARFIFFYSDPSAAFTAEAGLFPNITLATIENTAAVNIVKAIAAGQKVTVDFSHDFPGLVGAFYSAGGVPSGTTSNNALYDLTLKPDIAAPGRLIFSTWYLGNNYAIMSGTAMATPYVAGVAALYVSATGGRKVHGADFAKNFMSKVISSGKSLPYLSIITSFPEFDASVDQIGTGLIQADKILTYNTTLAFEKFSLNDTNHFSPQHLVNITNNGDTAVTYTFSLQPAGGYEALHEPNGGIFALDEFQPLNITPSVRFPSGNFVVQAGQTKVAEINFNMPDNLVKDLLPVYSGKIVITGSNGESLSVPYLGVGGNMQKMWDSVFNQALTKITTGFAGITPSIPISQPQNVSFNTDQNNPDFCVVGFALQWGVTEVRFDIFEDSWARKKWQYPPVPGEAGYIGSAAVFEPGSLDTFSQLQQSPELLVPFPLKNVRRTQADPFGGQEVFISWWMGALTNGSMIQPGKYQLLLAALTPFGTPKLLDDWSLYGPFEITVVPLPTGTP